ncbi:MAG TPA: 50S ribosomal protein L17 [Spirochaetota bacterium]|nr:50S ribosomal protein L17 [Spirochaetota bacterium]
MRHKNKVRQLGRTYAHRKAMFNNMVTSLFEHERIVTTKEKGKELKIISDKLITRAKNNIDIPETEAGKKLHNKREALKVIKDRDVLKKLFEDIAPRYVSRKGGYTRMYLLGTRAGDAAEMAIVELVERRKPEAPVKAEDSKKDKKKDKKEVKEKKDKKEKK